MSSARFRVGDCTVDMALREVTAPGARRPRRLTPKAIGVLALLVEHDGRVVSRDTLLARVWPGTLPTDDVITQAITQLRKAFDDERGNPRYIDTIAKHGYRLLAQVEWLEGEHAPATAAPATDAPVAAADAVPSREIESIATTAAGRSNRNAVIAAIAVIGVLLAGVLAWWMLGRTPPRQVGASGAIAPAQVASPSFRLITSVPGIEANPSLSPDGAQVAYSAIPSGQKHFAILVQTSDPSAPRALTHPDDADDSAPTWSPDGRQIAFLRVASGRDCKVLLMPANGGVERVVGACDPRNPPSFDWNHDGDGLVFSSRGVPHAGVGLRTLDLTSGAWQLLDYGATAQDVDFAPRYSPDGRWIVFVRNSPVGDLWRIPASGGTALRLTRLHADVRGWDWTPDGRSIVLARWSGSESRLLRLDLAHGGSVQDLGLADGLEPAIAANVPAMAFMNARSYFGIYRFALPGGNAGERLFASSGRDRLPVIAPDGNQLVFTSDRSGEFSLWWTDLRRADSLRPIEGLRPESWHPPDWSRDSLRVLVVGSGAEGSGLYEVVPASGRVARLPVPASEVVQAAYASADGDRVLVITGADEGRLRLELYDRSTQPWHRDAAIDDVAVARVDHAHARVLFTRPGRAGLWQADVGLGAGSIRLLDPMAPDPARYRSWSVAEDGAIYFLERGSDCASLLRRAGDPSSPRCLDPIRRAGGNGFSLSPRADAVFLTLSQWDGGDIGFMKLPQAPEVVGSR
ncbi:winged helix-turn-helix domain-containing protein [Lysobacter fragariae]